MKKLIKNCLIFLCFLATNASMALAQERFGQYVGKLENAKLNREQLVKLDLIPSRQTGNDLKLIALLSVYFGDFNSTEYVTYHFDDVKFNLLTGTLVFDQPDQDVTVIVAKFQNGEFEGTFRSSVAGNIGKLTLKRGFATTIAKPLVEPLWGEYRGSCQGTTGILQIETMRSSEDTSRVGNPFGTYDIRAQLAEVNPAACLEGSGACVMHTYESGTYDYFTGDVQLYGINRTLNCKTSANGLDCNGCAYTRKSNEASSGNYFEAPHVEKSFGEEAGTSAVISDGENSDGIAGQYTGYIYHERLGTYQKASLNIVAYQAPNTGNSGTQLMMSAVGTVYFGNANPESISYKFSERTYDLLSSQLVFERLSGDTDAVVQVTSIGKGVVKGVWHSMLYGRVGEFIMKKNDPVTLPSGAKLMDGIGGRYVSTSWLLDLKVARESTPINTRNPFFPLNFKGFARIPNLTANKKIIGGSYDYYTGKIAILVDDDSVFAGVRTSNTYFMLKHPTPATFRPIAPHAMQKFHLIEPIE